ncbi:MAG: trehalase-like domain-containing protein, partial [Burkholderiales bacterium]
MNNNAPLVTPNSLQVGMIGNCAYSALIDQQSRIVWCCLPRFDGDPVFNTLLDPTENGSLWAFELEDYERSEQFYEPNTAVLRTRMYDRKGQGIEGADLAPRVWSRGRTFRPLTLVRRVRVRSGSPRRRVLLRPRFDWGR